MNDEPTEDANPEQGGVSAPQRWRSPGADALAGLAMRKLAAQLGVQVSSLYSHDKTKDDLLHETSNQIMERRRRSRSAMRRLAFDDPAAPHAAATQAGRTEPAGA